MLNCTLWTSHIYLYFTCSLILLVMLCVILLFILCVLHVYVLSVPFSFSIFNYGQLYPLGNIGWVDVLVSRSPHDLLGTLIQYSAHCAFLVH